MSYSNKTDPKRDGERRSALVAVLLVITCIIAAGTGIWGLLVLVTKLGHAV